MNATITSRPQPEKCALLAHQNICLSEINLQTRLLSGFVELHLKPVKERFEKLRLNAKQCQITKLLMRSQSVTTFQPCEFTYNDPTLEIVPEESAPEEKTLSAFNNNHARAVRSTDPDSDSGQGEVVVHIPPDLAGSVLAGETLRLLIAFTIDNPSGGIHFVTPGPAAITANPNHIESHHHHATPNTNDERMHQGENGDHTSGQLDNLIECDPVCAKYSQMFTYKHHNNSRLWFPCIDSFNEPCTWHMEYTVDAHLTAISSGELIQSVLSQDKRKKTYKYELRTPTSAFNIGLVVGNFDTLIDPNMQEITHYFLPALRQHVLDSCSFLSEVFEFYEVELLKHRFPYPCYKQVFVGEAYEDCQHYATMSVCSTELLHTKHIIDQTFVTRILLAEAIAAQLFGCFISMSSWSGAWLTRGISSYIAAQYQKKAFGNNEYRYHVQEYMKRVIDYEQQHGGIVLDDSSKIAKSRSSDPPFHFSTQSPHTISPLYDQMHQLKSFLVVRMLEDRIGRELLLQVFNKLLSLASNASLQIANANAWSNMLLSTLSFETAVFTVTGKDKEIASFLEQWIYQGGHAKFNGRFIFDRKRNVVELEIKQSSSSTYGVRPYYGPITVNLQELDGTFPHKLNIEENKTTPFIITCHSKSRRNKKKKIPLCTGEEVDMDLSNMDNTDSPVLWIRIDPDMQLLRQVVFEQPDYQWQYQLRYERDVTAQTDAIRTLERYPTGTTRRTLSDIVEDKRCFWRVRCAATSCLSKVANQMAMTLSLSGGAWQAPTAMIGMFRRMFGSNTAPHIVRQNDFSQQNLQSYFIQKSLPIAIAGLRTPPHRTCPNEVFKFLIELFKYNDNSRNKFSDNYYRASLIEALAETITPVVVPLFNDSTQMATPEQLSPETKQVLEEITRCLNMEKILPCYRYTVTVACLKAIRVLQKMGHLPTNPYLFREYASYGLPYDVRCAAIQELVDVVQSEQSYDDLSFLLDIVETDAMPAIKYFVLSSLHKNAPDAHHLLNARSVYDRLWDLMNNSLAHDSKLRCATADVFFRFYGGSSRSSKNGSADGAYKPKKKKKKKDKDREKDRIKDKDKERKRLKKIERLRLHRELAVNNDPAESQGTPIENYGDGSDVMPDEVY
ncbi:Transcription initiation factor TFIID subunit 2, partial [Fragariocoptes setiger]